MKPVFTPLNEYDGFLINEGRSKCGSLLSYISEMQQEFGRLDNLGLDLTPDAAFKFLNLDQLQSSFYKELLQSGLLIDFHWEEWEEGMEVLQGIRQFQSYNPLKIFKIFTLIVRKDQLESGYFAQMLKNRTFLTYLLRLETLMLKKEREGEQSI